MFMCSLLQMIKAADNKNKHALAMQVQEPSMRLVPVTSGVDQPVWAAKDLKHTTRTSDVWNQHPDLIASACCIRFNVSSSIIRTVYIVLRSQPMPAPRQHDFIISRLAPHAVQKGVPCHGALRSSAPQDQCYGTLNCERTDELLCKQCSNRNCRQHMCGLLRTMYAQD